MWKVFLAAALVAALPACFIIEEDDCDAKIDRCGDRCLDEAEACMNACEDDACFDACADDGEQCIDACDC